MRILDHRQLQMELYTSPTPSVMFGSKTVFFKQDITFKMYFCRIYLLTKLYRRGSELGDRRGCERGMPSAALVYSAT